MKDQQYEQQKVSLIFYSEEEGKRTMIDKWGIEIGKKYTIGRSKKKVDISIQDITISRVQAELIFYDEDKIMIKDFDSSNGTYINKERIENWISFIKKVLVKSFKSFRLNKFAFLKRDFTFEK